jgi:hypothetical protein
MVAVRTLLSPARRGEIWRVQIVWPNGMVRHVGQFASEKEAAKWILAHPRLTMPAEESHDILTNRSIEPSGAPATVRSRSGADRKLW